MTNQRMVEVLAIVEQIAPSNQAAGTVNSTGSQLSLFRKRLYNLQVGAGGGAVVMKLQASVTGTSGWADVPGKATATLMAPGMAQIEVQADRLNGQGLGTYARVVITVAGAATQTSLLVMDANGRYFPASDYNAPAVAPAVIL